ncbi:hypothetical protein GBA52_013644 [Prunus armeniaca]|nr:hypothetical protein GBA52_013644 [Prunus armeniaca]
MMIANTKPAFGGYGYGYGYGGCQELITTTRHDKLGRKRKLNNPDLLQELGQNRRKIHNEKMTMVCGSCYLPKDNPTKPLGEDAHFMCQDSQIIGVADGVGGWAKIGVDAGDYARGLMNNAKKMAAANTAATVDPRNVGRDCEELASAVANLALFNSLDKYSVSPFQMEAEKAGLKHSGGKIDDITVVVAQIVASSTSFTTPASLGFVFEQTNTKRKRED